MVPNFPKFCHFLQKAQNQTLLWMLIFHSKNLLFFLDLKMIVCYRTGYFSRNFCENPVSVRKKQLMDIVKSGGENQVLSIPHGVCPEPKTTILEAFRAVLRHFWRVGGQFTICASRWAVWGLWCVTR